MPIYEYECKECKERFEALLSVNEDDQSLRCPNCQGNKLQKVLSLFSSASTKSSGAGCISSGST